MCEVTVCSQSIICNSKAIDNMVPQQDMEKILKYKEEMPIISESTSYVALHYATG